ncbi:MAG: hypothetical protein AAGF32_09745 [Pseudomonadota bacterium]
MSTQTLCASQWQQAETVAREICAQVFRKGGKPADAIALAGADGAHGHVHWGDAINQIAVQMCGRR